MSKGTIENTYSAKAVKFYTKENRIFLHPSSFNYEQVGYESVWMVYLKMVETSKLFVYDSTMIYPYALLLFAVCNIRVDLNRNFIIVFFSPPSLLSLFSFFEGK